MSQQKQILQQTTITELTEVMLSVSILKRTDNNSHLDH